MSEQPVPVIRMEAVTRVFPGPPPVTALHAADLEVAAGDYVAITGPSGSGKSTFLNLLGLLDRPSGGRYLLDGIDTGDLTESRRTALRGRRIGFVFQSFHLLPHRTAVENVVLAQIYNRTPRAGRLQAARQALADVGLSHRLETLPSRLSGGERQRVAIARALVNSPSLLLCDEPTGNLDSEMAAHVMELFEELHRRGLTLVVITHDRDVAARAERVVTIRDGRLHGGTARVSSASASGGRA